MEKEQIDYFEEMVKDCKRRRYTEGWPEEKWREEMEKHPLFMTKQPEPGDELSPLLEGLRDLKYSEDENTPDELAAAYKDEGNRCFQNKRYREAVINYKTGLSKNCSNDLKAQLHNNCGAAHFCLKNYRSALEESECALKYKPDYLKARKRIPHCLLLLEKYNECIEYCDQLLCQDLSDKEILSFKIDATRKKKIRERNLRKIRKQERDENDELEKIVELLAEKKVTLILPGQLKKLSDLTAMHLSREPRVWVDGNIIVWPVAFVIPEYNQMDIITDFRDNTTFRTQLQRVCFPLPPWDTRREYSFENLALYYISRGNAYGINLDDTLETILEQETCHVYQGSPTFYIFIRGSEAEKSFVMNPVVNTYRSHLGVDCVI